MSRRRIVWTDEMDAVLLAASLDLKVSREDVGQELGISVGAVRNRQQELGVSWVSRTRAGLFNPMYGVERPDFRENHWTKVGYDQSGEKNPAWKGGAYVKEYRGKEAYYNRPLALERDSYTCQHCLATGDLEVHHILPWSFSKDNSLENLVSLCKPCHKAANKFAMTVLRQGERLGVIARKEVAVV